MSKNIWQDMREMHDHYGVHAAVDKMSPEQLRQFLQFRLDFIAEEFNETNLAAFHNDPEEIVDGLIDLIVVAAGTLDAFGVDAEEAWYQVYKANMAKEVGIKETRPNPLGLPDLVKPEGWKGPDHAGNYGRLSEIK